MRACDQGLAEDLKLVDERLGYEFSDSEGFWWVTLDGEPLFRLKGEGADTFMEPGRAACDIAYWHVKYKENPREAMRQHVIAKRARRKAAKEAEFQELLYSAREPGRWAIQKLGMPSTGLSRKHAKEALLNSPESRKIHDRRMGYTENV